MISQLKIRYSAISLFICLSLNAGLYAQSNIKTVEGKFAFTEASSLAAEAQAKVYKFYTVNGKSLRESADTLKDKKSSINKTLNEQKSILANVDSELDKSILNLYAANTKAVIIPEIIKFNEGLLGMTELYKTEVYLLDSGPFFQRKRDALSLMISELRKEILNSKALISERKKVIGKIRDDLNDISSNPDSAVTRLGFSHFINLRLSLLLNQSLILSDIASINRGADLYGRASNFINPCISGPERFTNFLDQNNILSTYTYAWRNPDGTRNYDVSAWSSKRTDENRPDAKNSLKDIEGVLNGFTAKNGIYYPGVLSSLAACFGTKTNIYNDLKTKVETELSRGQVKNAINLDLLANDLEVEINRMRGQHLRLNQIKSLYSSLANIAQTASYEPLGSELTSEKWKLSIDSQLINLDEMVRVQEFTWGAAIKLLNLAQVEVQSLGGLTGMEQIKTNIFPVASRLNAIIVEGFERLERELDSSADSLNVMSLNVKSIDNTQGEGGLAEAIETYGKIVEIRKTQMRNEAVNELPKEKAEAEQKVLQVQNARSYAFALKNQIADRMQKVSTALDQHQKLSASFERFFSVNSSHPVYNSILNDFLARLAISKRSKSEVRTALSGYLLRLRTVSSNGVKSNLCRGKSEATCKGFAKTKSGRKIKALRKSYSKRLSSLIEVNSVSMLGQDNVSTLAVSISDLLSLSKQI